MKPQNSKELTKKVWQFLIIFFALAIIPVALIFFSYYKVPEKISESQEKTLMAYSNFEHTQKVIIRKMVEVDSNIGLYASASTENPKLLDKKIVDGLADLARMDTSIKIVQLVSEGYSNHYTHVTKLVDAQERAKKAELALQELKDQMKTMQSNPMVYPSGPPMSPP